MQNAIEVKNLRKVYNGFTLDDVSFTLPCGCIMGFIGENGAGKTTTIKAMLGLINKDGGETTLLGESSCRGNRELREHIGVVLADSGFPDNLSVKDIDALMRRCYRTWDSERFRGFTQRFSLPDNKPVKQFSRGMNMKLSIAAALSHDCKLLILDEATSGLDPIVRDEILGVFADFTLDEGHSIFISSHITSDLEKLCDYIAFIHAGKIVLCEPKDELEERYVVAKCTSAQYASLDKSKCIGARVSGFGAQTLMARTDVPQGITTERASLEDIMLYYVKEAQK